MSEAVTKVLTNLKIRGLSHVFLPGMRRPHATQAAVPASQCAPYHVPARRGQSLVPLVRCYAALRLRNRQTTAVARQAISTVGAKRILTGKPDT